MWQICGIHMRPWRWLQLVLFALVVGCSGAARNAPHSPWPVERDGDDGAGQRPQGYAAGAASGTDELSDDAPSEEDGDDDDVLGQGQDDESSDPGQDSSDDSSDDSGGFEDEDDGGSIDIGDDDDFGDDGDGDW